MTRLEFESSFSRKINPPVWINSIDDLYTCFEPKSYRIALPIPMCGLAGLWGPSCIASAELAVNELNKYHGIGGRKAELIIVDAAVEAEHSVAEVIDNLIRHQLIDAVVGMHISVVRQKLVNAIHARVPYVYTPLYEGGEQSTGVFAIGDTPDRQLEPAMECLTQKYGLKKSALIGNDYVWPLVSHYYAKQKIADLGASLVYENYLTFGDATLARQVQTIAKSGAYVVLISLIGQDAVDFNRIFGHFELDKNIVRLSCAIEENGLLASGENNVKRLFSSSSYFGNLNTSANQNFREQYHSLHGIRAPTLNSLGQSTYEGIHYLASLVEHCGEHWQTVPQITKGRIPYGSVRKSNKFSDMTTTNNSPIYLARADGLKFEVIDCLAAQN